MARRSSAATVRSFSLASRSSAFFVGPSTLMFNECSPNGTDFCVPLIDTPYHILLLCQV